MSSDTPDKSSNNDLADELRATSESAGFDLFGIAPAVTPTGFSVLKQWIDDGMAGEMHYMPRRLSAYEHPQDVLQSVKSLIVVGLNYFDPTVEIDDADKESTRGRIAQYANGSRDYHDVIKERIKPVVDHLHEQRPGCRTRVVVDTAPLLERDFARVAGLGWFGKNTMLINKHKGSWFFLGVILTDVELPSNEPHDASHCGTCTRCLEACPTNAFPEPYVLDARRCISYLTIELRDQPIDEQLRSQMDNWVFGCDVCQEVCPWNRKATRTDVEEFQNVGQQNPLSELMSMSTEEFKARFKSTPMERPRRDSFVRNAIIAAGNSGDSQFLPQLQTLLDDKSGLVRDTAKWAIGQIEARRAGQQ